MIKTLVVAVLAVSAFAFTPPGSVHEGRILAAAAEEKDCPPCGYDYQCGTIEPNCRCVHLISACESSS